MLKNVLKAKNKTLDDWKALSEEAQEFEIAAYEYDREQKLEYLDKIEKSLPRSNDGKISAFSVQSFMAIQLARLDLS